MCGAWFNDSYRSADRFMPAIVSADGIGKLPRQQKKKQEGHVECSRESGDPQKQKQDQHARVGIYASSPQEPS